MNETQQTTEISQPQRPVAVQPGGRKAAQKAELERQRFVPAAPKLTIPTPPAPFATPFEQQADASYGRGSELATSVRAFRDRSQVRAAREIGGQIARIRTLGAMQSRLDVVNERDNHLRHAAIADGLAEKARTEAKAAWHLGEICARQLETEENASEREILVDLLEGAFRDFCAASERVKKLAASAVASRTKASVLTSKLRNMPKRTRAERRALEREASAWRPPSATRAAARAEGELRRFVVVQRDHRSVLHPFNRRTRRALDRLEEAGRGAILRMGEDFGTARSEPATAA